MIKYFCFSYVVIKKVSHFDSIFMLIINFKNQRPEIIHNSMFLQTLDDSQHKVEMS